MIEKTLVLIKPDGVRRGIIGDVISRFERVGLKIVGMKMSWIDDDFAKRHYTEDISKRRGEAVRKMNVEFIREGPVVAIVVEGVEAIGIVRKIVGDTEPKNAIPGTIRGDYCHVSYGYADKEKKVVKNVIHASSNKEDADNEVRLWFSDSEMFEYKINHENEMR